jgi:cytochrome c-type biogenesis protein CcmH/NrfG
MRAVASALDSAVSAAARDFGGSGNAGAATSVSALARSTIRIANKEGIVAMKSALGILALVVACNTGFAADTGGSSSSMRSDPMMDRYTAASEKQDWKSAAAVMQDALTKDPNNADYHNLYAYSLRRSGTSEMDQVFKHYNEALRLDPKHKGAHEYMGEAYLMLGNVAKAKEHLSALDKLCFFGCSEYTDLKKAIAEHEAKVVKQ